MTVQPARRGLGLWVNAAMCVLSLAVSGPARAGAAPENGRAAIDAVVLNANIYTMDPDRPRAQAMALAGGRIAAVGSNSEVVRTAGPGARVEDLGGLTLLPGLIDAHGHVGGLGAFGMGRLDLSLAGSFEGVVRAVEARAREIKPGTGGGWIVGGRWDHESWPGKSLPTHAALSAVTPGIPVWLRRVDGHAGLANAAAMKIAGVTRDTPSPAGGEIIRDADGNPTGVFVDNAMGLIARHVPEGEASAADLVLRAQEMCLSAGLTGVHDAGVSPSEIEVYRRLSDDGRLKLRIYAMVSAFYAVRYFAEHPVTLGERLTVRSAKLYIDGAMGSRGAWLLEPYADRPRTDEGEPYTGLAVTPVGDIEALAADGLTQGYQVCTHAIGDRGNHEVLDAYERALRGRPTPDHRFRIEHAQLLAPGDIPRFAALGVVPSMQPTHCTSDMRWVEARVGSDRARGAYAWAGLLRTGARIAGGSDFPVESHNPFLGLYAAVTRQTPQGQPDAGWRPEERMTREEALRAFTLDAAYAAFEENEKGSLSPGKLADFIVVDRDVMTCNPQDIPGARVLRTVIGGETVFRAD